MLFVSGRHIKTASRILVRLVLMTMVFGYLLPGLFNATTVSAQPANNVCAGYIIVPQDGSCTSGTTVNATDNWTSTVGCQAGNNPEVWYAFNADSTNISIEVTAGTMTGDLEFIMVEAPLICSGGLSLEASSCGPSVLTDTITGLTAGMNYIFTISSSTGGDGTFDVCITSFEYPPISASDCSDAVDICNNLGFQIQPDGFGSISEIPALGTVGNPNNANPGGSGNWGCLRGIPPETNSTWMILNIDGAGMLEFTFGGNGAQTGFYDWIMYPWSPSVCTDIPGGNLAPVRCNWNACVGGGTGLAASLPGGACKFQNKTNFEAPLPVQCGEKYIICFSNYSSVTTNVPLEFFGTASVTCTPLELQISVIPPNPVICPGESVELTAAGADTYVWSPATGLSDTTGTIVVASPTVTTTYTIVGTAGCYTGDTVITVVVTDINAGFTYSGSQCLSGNNISFTNTGDAPGSCGGGCPTYTWDYGDGTNSSGTNAGAANPNHTYTAAGTFTITQTVDDGSCTEIYTLDIVISDPVSSVIGTEESCTDGCDGAINLTVLGGIAPLTYAWSNGASTEDILDVCSGTYTVTVTDAFGCTTTSSTILNPIVDIIGGFTYNGNQCLLGNNYIFTNNGDTPGSCGTNCPSYWWDYGDGSTSSGVDAAAANPSHTYATDGTYTVTQVITDGSGCSDTTTLVIQVLDPPVATSTGVDESCLDACNGTATVTTTGGAAIINYNWSNGGSTQNLTGLCAGTYTVTVTDLNGCQDTASVTINSGTEIKAGFTYNGNQCLSGNSYSFTNLGSVPGVCGPGCPTYIWDFGDASTQTGTTAGDASPTHTYGAPGIYTVTQIVTDGGPCTDTMIQVITVYPEPTITIVPTDLSCPGACDGSADLTILTGTQPYTYNWSNFESAQDLNGVCAGTYDVTVTDSVGCTVTGTVIINEPPPIVITLTPTDPSCSGVCDGSISSSVSGGNTPHTYLWDDPGNQTNAIATGLCAGTYMLWVTDANGCSDSDTVSIVTPPLLTSTTSGTDALCNGACDGTASVVAAGGTPPYTYLWNDPGFQSTSTANGLCAGLAIITVTDGGGCTVVDTFIVAEPPLLTATATGNPALCSGATNGDATVTPAGGTTPYTYSWDDPGTQTTATATGLGVGTYIATVTDSAGCTTTASFAVTEPTPVTSSTSGNDASCFGVCDGDATATGAGGTGPYTYVWDDPGTQTNANAVGLCAGTANVTVTDSQGCFTTDSYLIGEPTAVTASTTGNPTSCNGVCDGDATVSPGGGTGAYTYNWDDPGTQTTATAAGLCAGPFNVTVEDANGCQATSNFTVTQPVALTSGTAGNDASCNGVCDGDATVTPAGGTSPYTYTWDDPGFQTTATANGLCAGTFNVTVEDTNGCQVMDSYVVGEPSAIVITPGSTPATCGGTDGTATASAAGGTPLYTYLWSDTQTTSTATGLGAAGYSVTVTDANGCQEIVAIGVSDAGAPSATISDSTLVLCFGGNNGSATVTPAGGTAPYTYLWDDPGTQTDSIATGLVAGTYTATVEDVVGCIATATVVITEPLVLNTSVTASTNPSCFGICDGDATASTSGGTTPYTFGWDDPGTQTNAIATGLCDGIFNILVTDANNCTATDAITLTEPTALALSTTQVNVSCNGGADGSIDLTVGGGTPTYTFAWDNSASIEDVSSLAQGDYEVIVTDANGCKDSVTVTITEPTAIVLTPASSDANCGQADGGVSVSAIGGTGAYTYNWDDPGLTLNDSVNNLLAGIYNVTVEDANGCQVTSNATINDVGGGTASITDSTMVLCNGGNNGDATVTATGGTAPYTYSWNDLGSQTTTQATGLVAGTYIGTITDAVGCISSATVTITEPAILNTVITASTNPSCFGVCDGDATSSTSGGTTPYTYSWDDPATQSTAIAVGLCDGVFNVLVTDSNGCTATDAVTLVEPVAMVLSFTQVNVSCSGGTDGSIDLTVSGGTPTYTFAWDNLANTEDLTNLAQGPYEVIVTDANGCKDSVTITITEPTAIALSTIDVDANCGQADGSSTVSGTGGTGAYTYSWNTSPIQTNALATGLAAGAYIATVTDSNGCFTTINVTIVDIPGGSASAVVDNNTSGFNICDGQATGSMTGGTGPYTYLWNDPSAQTTATATGLCDGTFCITITDANGCPDSACITITEPGAIILTIVGTDNLCNSDCNGAADLAVTGGTTPYTYLWTPGGMTAQDIVNLCAGIYSVDVTDSNGVVTSASVTITEPVAPLAATVVGTDILCNGQSTGAIDLSVTGGTTPYTYSWAPGGETTEDLSNLGAGLNTVTVTDTNGCTTTASYTVIEPPAIALLGSGINANCGQTDGQASVAASGGTTPFTYSWNTSPVQTTNTATAIPAGSYTVVVTDSSGCIDSTTVSVSDIGGGAATVVTDNNASCFGDCDGQASISVVGGTVPLTYLWDDPAAQTNAVANNLCAGAFNVSATDAVGCLLTGSATITEPAAITLGATGTDASCAGLCNGSATTTISGGSAPYTYLWSTSPVQTNSNATGLCVGNYSVTVTDANGCDTVQTVVINEPLAMVVSTTTTTSTCGQANGVATATVANGTGPYTYLWDDLLSQTNDLATGLLAGAYSVTVTDVFGCIGIGTAAVSDTTGPLAAITTNIGVNCPGDIGGSLTVFVSDGSSPYTYTWDDPSAQTNIIATGLAEGLFTVTVVDATGCITTASDSITAPPLLVISISSSTNPSCNSVCDGSITVAATGGTSPYTFVWDDPAAQTSLTATGLCALTYLATVTDANGCTDTISTTLTEPLLLNASTTMSPVSCSGACDGSIATTVSGGTTPYTYTWDDPALQTTITASSLCAGGFNVTVADANGCTSILTDTVTEPAPLVSTVISIVGVSCNGACDGSAEIAITGGTAPLTYLWSDGQTAALAINLCGGALTVDVTDANGCTVSDNVTIPEPAAIANVFSSTNVDCFGNATGIATAGITGGTTPYTYLWDDLNFQTTASATGLIAGTYTVLVTDSSGCTLSENITITEPVAIVMTLDTTGANCGLADGSACVTVSAGVAPFTYQWDDSGNQTTACATAIASGTYNVTVTDATGCFATGLVVVNDLGAPNLLISSFADANCNGGCDGFATVQILNGDPPFVYSWDDPNNQTTANASGLCAGTYIVSILDSNNCSGSISASIGEPTALNVVISSQTVTTCNAGCDATATALGSGGTPPYSYLWNDPGLQTTQTAVGLCAGTYGLTIIDSSGCTDTTSVTILEPSVITLTTSTVDANCGLSDGSATVSATGGNGLYGYLWDDLGSQNTATAVSIPAGPYNVLVTDILGCMATASVIVGDQPAGIATIAATVDVSCNGGSDGSATVSMAGGTLPFTYLWNDPFTQTTVTATSLDIGSVTVTVTDSNGCIVTVDTTINEPILIQVTVVGFDESCYGSCDGSATAFAMGGTGVYTYEWDDPLAQTSTVATGLCAGPYTVTVSDINGCSSTALGTVGSPDSIVLSETHSNANCGQADGIATVTVVGGTSPYSYLWNPGGQTTPFVTNLLAGTYFVTVTDSNSCTESIPVTISDLNGPTASILSTVDVDCNGGNNGQAIATVVGGTPGYVYSWNDSLNQVTPTAGNLAAGVYTLTVVDTSGCIASVTATINEPSPIVFNPASTDPTCFGDCDGSVGVSVIGGTPPYQYSWNDPASQTTATAVSLCAGTYIGIITDTNSCTDIATISISNPLPITSSVSATDESCFGACDGSVTVSPNNGTGAYTYLWDDPFTQATQTASNLCVGGYNVLITDNNGCTATASDSVYGPGQLTVTISSSGNNPCAGYCQGFAQTAITGGIAPFTYLWSDGQTGAQAINLCADIFDVTVTDVNGCTAQVSVTITEPQGMALNVTGVDISCNGLCDGTATASVSGGVPPYTYLWNDGAFQTTPVATALCAGIYSVTVTDVGGCIQTSTIILTEPQPLTLNSTTVSSTCGFANGSACVTVVGGSSPYVITWNDPNTTPGACIFSVFAGTYNPIVSDANGCTFTMPVVINDITGPSVDTTTTTDVVCAGDSNGTATIIASGVAQPLTYIWKDNSGNTIDSNVTTVFGLWGGTFTVTVIDANGCISGALVTITEPAALNSAIISSSPATCNGNCDGSATIMTGGGVTPYTYLWTDGQSTATASGLCAGTHSIIVTDANGCTDINIVTIAQPAPLVINDSINDVSCFGLADGSIYTNVTGGTPFYSYVWNPPAGNNSSATNLAAQVFDVTVTDFYNCTATATMTVNEPADLTFTTSSAPSTCGINNGSATVNMSGGTAPYTYAWDDPLNTTTATVIDLIARDPWNVTVTDANGCVIVIPVTVFDEPAPTVDSIQITNVVCKGAANGIATVFFNGGTGPVTYLWDDPAAQDSSSATGLDVGTIGVTITDSNGCQTPAFAVITEPDSVLLTTSPDVTICYGDSTIIWASASGGTLPYNPFTWTNLFSGSTQTVGELTTTTYTVLISDANGCVAPPGVVVVTVNPLISIVAPDQVICEGDDLILVAQASGGVGDTNGYIYSWNNGAFGSSQTITGLMDPDDGYYIVTVTDSCAGVAEDTVFVTVNPAPNITFDSDGSGCFPYVFVAYTSLPDSIPVIDWLWDFGDGNFSTDSSATTHAYTDSGTYDVTLTVTSIQGCTESFTETAAATVFALPTADFTMSQNGSIIDPPVLSEISPWVDFMDISVSNVDSVYWDFGDPLSETENTSSLSNPTHEFSDTGTYSVLLVAITTNGCIDSIRHEIVIESEFILFAPNAFSPNGDLKNDYFMPKGIGVENETFEMYIFDRWGDLIAKVVGEFSDDPTIGWDGRANDGEKTAQIDVYVWLIRTEDVNGDAHEYVGHVTLLE